MVVLLKNKQNKKRFNKQKQKHFNKQKQKLLVYSSLGFKYLFMVHAAW